MEECGKGRMQDERTALSVWHKEEKVPVYRKRFIPTPYTPDRDPSWIRECVSIERSSAALGWEPHARIDVAGVSLSAQTSPARKKAHATHAASQSHYNARS